MGVDVEITVVIPKTAEALNILLNVLTGSEKEYLYCYDDKTFRVGGRTYNKKWLCLRIGSPYRYYGPGYERGPWPAIKSLLERLMKRLYGVAAVIMYGGDYEVASVEVTPAMLKRFTEHYEAEEAKEKK